MKDVYVLGRLAYQTDTNGTVLATFTYDSTGVPVSVQVGSDPSTAPRYYYVYNGHGDTVALVDAAGTTVASYGYDSFGLLMSDTERFANGWSNPYRYDGRDGVRYDRETGLYWMSVRAYDPALGRFLSRDPLGRVPLFFADQAYVYAGNNPLTYIDPSGQMQSSGDDGGSGLTYTYYGHPLSENVDFLPFEKRWTHVPFTRMRRLAHDIIVQQNLHGGPGKGQRTYGGAALWYTSIATKGARDIDSSVLWSLGPYSHVEDRAIAWATGRIHALVHQWGDKAWGANFDVHLLVTRPPCGPHCVPNFLSGAWMNQLKRAADRKLPGAIGGSTDILIKLWVWVIEPNPRNKQGGSQIRLWRTVTYDGTDEAIWKSFPWYIFLEP